MPGFRQLRQPMYMEHVIVTKDIKPTIPRSIIGPLDTEIVPNGPLEGDRSPPQKEKPGEKSTRRFDLALVVLFLLFHSAAKGARAK
jgi:hypothetical protein